MPETKSTRRAREQKAMAKLAADGIDFDELANSSSTEEYNKFDSKVPAPSEPSRAPTTTSRPPPPPSSSQANEKANEPENVHGEQVVDEQDEQVRAPKRITVKQYLSKNSGFSDALQRLSKAAASAS